MSELQAIVEHLNRPPFRLGLTLVEFDEKVGFDLLRVVNLVLVELDGNKHDIDVRKEPDEVRTQRILEFLQLLKFPLPASGEELESFRDALDQGDKRAVYPILHWLLKSLGSHKKRAYLGRFLGPLPIPQEFFADPELQRMQEQLQELQNEFKQVHKQVDRLRTSKSRPAELRREISQLEDEGGQLEEKIAHLRKKTSTEKGFSELLEATSSLRKEQEKQAGLADRKRDQMTALSMAEKKVSDAELKLSELRATLKQDASPEALVEQLQSQIARQREMLTTRFPDEFKAQHATLERLEKTLSEPAKTEADLVDLEDEISGLQQAISSLQRKIAEAQEKAGDDKLAIFRQHAVAQTKKRMDKEEQVKAKQASNNQLQQQIDETEAKLHEGSMSNGKFMSREQFKQYATTLRNKTNQYKRSKNELAELTAESVVLHRTEQLLKSKLPNLDVFEKEMEANKQTESSEKNASAVSDVMEEVKEQTLEEVSKTVTDLNHTLKERKNALAPQIKELRAVRAKYQDMEQIYLERKAQYEHTAVGLETERLKLEQECQAFQDDCLREERQYHTLNCEMEIVKGKAEKVQQEKAFEVGEGHLLRDMKTFQDLYKHKVAQQEVLTKELRKQQKHLKENASELGQQRRKFEQLLSLLELKNKCAKEMNNGGNEFGGFEGKNDRPELASAHFDVVGGANVMTLID